MSAISAGREPHKIFAWTQLLPVAHWPPCRFETFFVSFVCDTIFDETPTFFCFCLFFGRHLRGRSGGTRGGIHQPQTPENHGENTGKTRQGEPTHPEERRPQGPGGRGKRSKGSPPTQKKKRETPLGQEKRQKRDKIAGEATP